MHESLAIRGGRDTTGRRVDLAIRNGVLAEDTQNGATFDATGLVVAPGFIDLQVNGAAL